ncbi:TraU family protein [Ramlibacter humi]|uniref:Conjugal transfer protein n=1 Tax=Ramlibacter humi TaxID=2530451 RepID=A0A4Z0BNT1_9BURK|nr:TraU family protein [Ramlibacter humi]TFZ00080.1 hypothetical protein EZ216_13295 [Ramlibacter humi]
MRSLRASCADAWIRRLRVAAALVCCCAVTHVHAAAPADWSKVFEVIGDLKKYVPGAKLEADSDSALGQAAGAVAAVLGVAADAEAGKEPAKCSAWKGSTLDYGKLITAGLDNFDEEWEWFEEFCQCQMMCIDVLTPAPGTSMQFWQGETMIEVVREPGCSPISGEIPIPIPKEASDSSGGRNGFYHVHIIPSPILLAMAEGMELLCHWQAFADAIPLYYSELDPSWNPEMQLPDVKDAPYTKGFADSLATFTWKDILSFDPVIFTKKLGYALGPDLFGAYQAGESLACVAECLAITAGFEPFSFPPFDNCSGCNGLLTPYTGDATAVGGRRAAELMANRVIKLQVNRLLWQSTTVVQCAGAVPMPGGVLFPKNDFRLQLIYPEDKSKAMRKFGAIHVPVLDEFGKQGGLLKQDYVFQLWKRRKCCATLRPCVPIPLPYS